ncbi:MAG TPA: response regulator [Candidatus Omnitrophota bacterium]|mgnify:CR=1 FL=1|nr:response regulator [Candidatus Omnitrophota bacterium]HQJ15873.1 response regulator [Candidatus Omnitrophota bacterium]
MAKILIVDDEVEIVRILEKFLTKMSYEVVSTSDGEKAISLLGEDKSLNMAILDMKMPRIKGIDILKTMAERNITLPVIVLTGSFDEEKYLADLQKLGYGHDDILLKPIDLNELLTMVKEKLGKKT